MNGYLILFLVVLVILLIGVALFFIAKLYLKKEIESDANNPNRIKVTKSALIQAFVIVVVLSTVFYFKESGHLWASILIAMLYIAAQVYKYSLIKKVSQ